MNPFLQGVSPVAHLSGVPVADAAAAGRLAVCDLSLQPRFGCKGPQAAAWLASQGIAVPAAPNSACPGENGVERVLRLGLGEFLVEADAARIASLYAAQRQPGVYPVLRQDACFGLRGDRLNDLLLQTCNVNFSALAAQAAPVVLTSMAGVGVVVLPDVGAATPNCRIWCDGTFGPYLWRTLLAIAVELGGGASSAPTPFP